MSKLIYDFSGKMTDRSEVKYEFDGLDTTIFIEDQSNPSGHFEISFSRVAQFDFMSLAVHTDYPSEIAEKLIEKDVSAEFLKRVRPDSQSLFQKGLKLYEIFLEDTGTFRITACSVGVKRTS